MQGLQTLLAFAETAKRGNFAAASREIGCTPSTLAKAVARLERQLGVRLFHRTTRQVTLRPMAMPVAAVMPSARLIPNRVRALLELIERSAGAFPSAPPVISTAKGCRPKRAATK